MRVAVMVLSLCLSVLLLAVSCTVTLAGQGGGSLTAVFLSALLWLIGAAFALGKPRVSTVAFVLAMLLGGLYAFQGAGLMWFWAVPSLILAVLSTYGETELRKKRASEARPVEVNVH